MSGRHSSSKRPSKLRLWTSSNVVAGFRKAGIHPFNDKAIAIPVNGEAVSHHNAENCSQEPSEIIDLPSTPTVEDHGMGGSVDETSSGEPETSFTPAEVQLYQHRIDEGYDTFTDQRYLQWVKLNHPALLPASLRQHQTISSPLIETANEYHIESDDDQQIAATSQSQPPLHQSLTEENGDNRLHQTQITSRSFH